MWLDEANAKGIQYAYMKNQAGVVSSVCIRLVSVFFCSVQVVEPSSRTVTFAVTDGGAQQVTYTSDGAIIDLTDSGSHSSWPITGQL